MKKKFERIYKILKAIMCSKSQIRSNQEHLELTMQWLCRAQDVNPGGGVAAWYDLKEDKWKADYPEVTGYIIPTFFDYYHLTGQEEFRERALRMTEWECQVQMKNGATQSGTLEEEEKVPAVFNTGQVIFGWLRAYNETKDEKFLISLRKAADYLCEAQDNDGVWRQSSSVVSNQINTYNARTAWALAKVSSLFSENKYKKAALANIGWVLTQQKEKGWFDNAGFSNNTQPLLHTIAYTMRGILETGKCLEDKELINKVIISADALIEKQLPDGSLKGVYGKGWEPGASWSCLTGNAQIAIIWFRVYGLTLKKRYLTAALKANDYLKTTQSLTLKDPNVRGGIKGSQPIYGGYHPWRYLSWAAKFFADALIEADKYK
jgi:uncharacterized protein YyaL (SSP411 family)